MQGELDSSVEFTGSASFSGLKTSIAYMESKGAPRFIRKNGLSSSLHRERSTLIIREVGRPHGSIPEHWG